MNSFEIILFVLGLYVILPKIKSLLEYLRTTFFLTKDTKSLLNKLSNGKTLNGETWAVVTGCTAGIGEETAYLLAKQGLNIVLISRSNEKLQKVA